MVETEEVVMIGMQPQVHFLELIMAQVVKVVMEIQVLTVAVAVPVAVVIVAVPVEIEVLMILHLLPLLLHHLLLPPPPPSPPPSPPPDDGFDPCFTEETRVLMWTDDPDSEDLIMRPISQIMVGDYVMNKDRTKANKVVFVQKHSQLDQHPDVYSPSSEIDPFATLHHPLFIDGEWVAVKTNYFPWLEKNPELIQL